MNTMKHYRGWAIVRTYTRKGNPDGWQILAHDGTPLHWSSSLKFAQLAIDHFVDVLGHTSESVSTHTVAPHDNGLSGE